MTSLRGDFPSVQETCAHIKHLGYATSRRIRLYGEDFEVVSDPFPEADGIAIHVRTSKDSRIRTEIEWGERVRMFLQELFASIRARLRRSTRHREEDGAEIARRLQELLAKATEIETLSTSAPIDNDPSRPYRDKTGT